MASCEKIEVKSKRFQTSVKSDSRGGGGERRGGRESERARERESERARERESERARERHILYLEECMRVRARMCGCVRAEVVVHVQR